LFSKKEKVNFKEDLEEEEIVKKIKLNNGSPQIKEIRTINKRIPFKIIQSKPRNILKNKFQEKE
jgi:hypothetical protein